MVEEGALVRMVVPSLNVVDVWIGAPEVGVRKNGFYSSLTIRKYEL
jgi:hypothetical protein